MSNLWSYFSGSNPEENTNTATENNNNNNDNDMVDDKEKIRQMRINKFKSKITPKSNEIISEEKSEEKSPISSVNNNNNTNNNNNNNNSNNNNNNNNDIMKVRPKSAQVSSKSNSNIRPISAQSAMSLKKKRVTPKEFNTNTENKRSKLSDDLSIDEWCHHKYCDILHVRINDSDGFNKKYALLRNYVEDTSCNLLSLDTIDMILMERLGMSFSTTQSPWLYLVTSYGRCRDMMKEANLSNEKLNVLNELRKHLVTYSGLILIGDLNEDTNNKSYEHFQRLLEAQPQVSRTLPDGYLNDLCNEFEDGIQDIFKPILDNIVNINYTEIKLNTCDRKLRLMAKMTRHSNIASLLLNHEKFIVNALFGRQFENWCILGPYFGLGKEAEEEKFQGNMIEVESKIRDIKLLVKNAQEHLFNIVDPIVKKRTNNRERILKWFLQSLQLNMQRRKIQYDHNSVCTPSFGLNVCYVLLRIMQKILIRKGKIRSVNDVNIDTSYILDKNKCRLTFLDCTRISKSSNELDEITKTIKVKEPISFSTEIFFLLHEWLNTGVLSVVHEYTNCMRDYGRLQRHLESIDRNSFTYKQLETHRDRLINRLCTLKIHLSDEDFVQQVMFFCDWSCKWLENEVEVNKYFGYLPESLITTIIEYVSFCGELLPKETRIGNLHLQNLTKLVVNFMGPLSMIPNPHIKGECAKLLAILAEINHPFIEYNELHDILLPNLLHSYVEIEYGDNAYSQKFETRHRIATLLKKLWSSTKQRQMFVLESEKPSFEKFMNVLINDNIYLADEGLRMLSEIRTHQEEEKTNNNNNTNNNTNNSEFIFLEGNCKSVMMLLNSTLDMLYYLTDTKHGGVIEPFVSNEFVQRMADMVAYLIEKMVGPEMSNLKVQNKERYFFRPKEMLTQIISIFLHLSKKDIFLHAVAANGRSYSPEVFAKAPVFIKKYSLLSSKDIIELDNVLETLKQYSQEVLDAEERLGDIPDEFLDPLMATLMSDPVTLPVSKKVMDRSIIKRHLMNDPHDPFTRTPLTIDEVETNHELKKKIDEFKRKAFD